MNLTVKAPVDISSFAPGMKVNMFQEGREVYIRVGDFLNVSLIGRTGIAGRTFSKINAHLFAHVSFQHDHHVSRRILYIPGKDLVRCFDPFVGVGSPKWEEVVNIVTRLAHFVDKQHPLNVFLLSNRKTINDMNKLSLEENSLNQSEKEEDLDYCEATPPHCLTPVQMPSSPCTPCNPFSPRSPSYQIPWATSPQLPKSSILAPGGQREKREGEVGRSGSRSRSRERSGSRSRSRERSGSRSRSRERSGCRRRDDCRSRNDRSQPLPNFDLFSSSVVDVFGGKEHMEWAWVSFRGKQTQTILYICHIVISFTCFIFFRRHLA